ncbi:PHP domain-containing protein [Mogibacterium diversum]|uniref:PHP domain-containing protein n=1 Tax=Mogibacterium diversum TaxID=114527 RepID=UPI0028E6E440|nr:PHP domain-containing protein [Mogibacterium diversum]
MNDNRILVDMHLHTTASDGSYSPVEVMQMVREAGVNVFSLTDHDTTAGVNEIQDKIPEEMEFYNGIEFSCEIGDIKCHILGYSYDDEHPDFKEALAAAESKRENKLAIRIEHLREVDGIELTNEEVEELESIPSAGKPHIANILMRRGVSGTRTEIINKYLEFGVDNRIPAELAIKAIRASGGVAIWAHPLGGENEIHMNREELEEKLGVLQVIGIEGLECFYSRYDDREIAMLLEIAESRRLLVSGGSDFHGKNKNVEIGELGVSKSPVYDSDLSLIAELRRRRLRK